MSSKIEEAAKDFESIEKKIEEFSDMLSKIEHADAKKKILIRQKIHFSHKYYNVTLLVLYL